MEQRAEGFQVDVIQSSLVDLQKEKEKTEQKLQDARKKRLSLEKKCETVLQRYNQMSENHHKMMETVKVAQYKVNQSQAQIDSQQAVNQEKQEKINELLQLMELENGKEQRDLEEFQLKISELTNQFRNARHFYTDESLQLETSMLEKRSHELKNKVSSAKCEVANLQSKLAELEEVVKTKKDSQKPEVEFTEEEQRDILMLFTLEKENSEKMLEALKQKEACLKDEIRKISDETQADKQTVEE